MPITVKGNITAGETTIKTASPAVINKNSIHEKIKSFAKEPETVSNIEQIQTKIESVKSNLHRQIPIKTNDLSETDRYQNVMEGELIKHYNKKSLYLADMIDDSTDS